MRRRRSKGGASAQESLKQQALGRSRGGFSTKIHVLCEGAGLPITVLLTSGQTHESTMLAPLLSAVESVERTESESWRFDVISGDKGYDGQAQRAAIVEHGSTPLIPHRKRRDGSPGGDGASFDKVLYKRRNVVERLIGRIKEYRRVATRYDKLAESFRCFVVIAFIRIRTNDLMLARA
jgi:transposase